MCFFIWAVRIGALEIDNIACQVRGALYSGVGTVDNGDELGSIRGTPLRLLRRFLQFLNLLKVSFPRPSALGLLHASAAAALRAGECSRHITQKCSASLPGFSGNAHRCGHGGSNNLNAEHLQHFPLSPCYRQSAVYFPRPAYDAERVASPGKLVRLAREVQLQCVLSQAECLSALRPQPINCCWRGAHYNFP